MSLTIKIDYKSYVDRLLQALRGLNIYHLLLFSLALHLLILGQPNDGFVFDEAHYVPAALETLKGLPANVEHTPLTKILVAVSIGLLGNWWFAWRIPIVVFSLVATF